MFDLFRSQDKMKRIMLGAILGVVSLGMLLYLIPGQGVPNAGGDDQTVADVGGTKITTREVYRRIQAVFKNNPMPPDVLEVYVPQLIEAMVADQAVAYEAQRMGFKVTDEELARQIRSTPQLATLTPEQYQATIEQMGYSVPEFENDMRKNAVESMLKDVAAEGVIVTPQEAEDAYRQMNEKIKLAYVIFTPDKFKADINPTPAELQAYYNGKKAGFTVPESRNVNVILIDQDKVAASIQTSDAQLRAYYDSHKDDFRTPDRVRVRHILLQTVGKNPDEVKKIRAKADDLLKQIKAGGNFAELAQKFSEDPGTKDKGGEYGWMTRGQTVKNFEAAAFSLQPGQTSDVITTEYGFHILQVEEKSAAGLQPFDKVKDQIAAELSKSQVNDRMQNLADQARAQLVKAPQSGEQIANSLGLQFVKADNVQPSGVIPGVGVNKDLSDAIASDGKGQATQVIQVTPARLAIAVVTSVNAQRSPALSEVEASVRAGYITEKSGQLLQQRAKEAAATLAKDGGDLQALAKSLGLEVKESDLFTRNGSVGGNMGASFFGDAFTKPVGTIIGPLNASGQTVVAKVVDKQQPDNTAFAMQKGSIVSSLKQKKMEERSNLFQDSILTKLEQQGKVKIYKNVVNQIMQRYRAS
jgi:peptidyl-prolyl cis-trans isomerase D